jgi:hypothetical protein
MHRGYRDCGLHAQSHAGPEKLQSTIARHDAAGVPLALIAWAGLLPGGDAASGAATTRRSESRAVVGGGTATCRQRAADHSLCCCVGKHEKATPRAMLITATAAGKHH